MGIRITKQSQHSDKEVIREQLEIGVNFRESKGLGYKENDLDGIGKDLI